MKILCHSSLFATVTLTVMVFSARASLVTGTDPAFGANSLTIDTQTQLAWLNLSYTAGLSYNQVIADMQPGGIFSNYTFANPQQIDGLYIDAGIGAPGNYPLSTPAIVSLISLIGSGATDNGYPGFSGTLGTSATATTHESAAIFAYGDDGTEVYFVGDGVGPGNFSYGDAVSYPGLGDFLVTPVPEAGVGSVGIIGLIASAIVRRIKFPSSLREPRTPAGP